MAGWVQCIKKPTLNSVPRRSRGWQQGLLPQWASSLRLTRTGSDGPRRDRRSRETRTTARRQRHQLAGSSQWEMAHTRTHTRRFFGAPRHAGGPGRCFQRLARPTGTALPGLGCCGGGPPSSFQYGAWQLRIAGAVRRRRIPANGLRLGGQSHPILACGRFDPRKGQKRATRIRYLGPDVKRGKGREELRELHASDCEVAQPSSVARIRKKTSAWVNDCPDGHILVGCNFSARR